MSFILTAEIKLMSVLAVFDGLTQHSSAVLKFFCPTLEIKLHQTGSFNEKSKQTMTWRSG